jgi:hypothetical protein
LLRFLRLLFGLEHPTRRELLATRDALDGLEARVDNHYRELKELRGRVNAMRRWEKAAEDAPGDENGEDPVVPHSPAAPPATAHLARRFRSF